MRTMRVDHVGSLLRPESLKAAFRRCAAGELSAAALEKIQDDAVRDVVHRQEALGLPVISDGEYRRLNWQVAKRLAADGAGGNGILRFVEEGAGAALHQDNFAGDDAVLPQEEISQFTSRSHRNAGRRNLNVDRNDLGHNFPASGKSGG